MSLAALLLISWTAPTHNINGTLLTDLDGFVVYCSQTLSALESSPIVEVSASELSAPLTLTAGTWYCGVKARNTQDTYSALSETVTHVVEAPPPPPSPEYVTKATAVVALKRSSATGKYWIVRKLGQLPLGSPCIAPALLRDYYQVSGTFALNAGEIPASRCRLR